MFTKFRSINKKNENRLYTNADISSSDNSIKNESSQIKKIQDEAADNSYHSPKVLKKKILSPCLSKRHLR